MKLPYSNKSESINQSISLSLSLFLFFFQLNQSNWMSSQQVTDYTNCYVNLYTHHSQVSTRGKINDFYKHSTFTFLENCQSLEFKTRTIVFSIQQRHLTKRELCYPQVRLKLVKREKNKRIRSTHPYLTLPSSVRSRLINHTYTLISYNEARLIRSTRPYSFRFDLNKLYSCCTSIKVLVLTYIHTSL